MPIDLDSLSSLCDEIESDEAVCTYRPWARAANALAETVFEVFSRLVRGGDPEAFARSVLCDFTEQVRKPFPALTGCRGWQAFASHTVEASG